MEKYLLLTAKEYNWSLLGLGLDALYPVKSLVTGHFVSKLGSIRAKNLTYLEQKKDPKKVFRCNDSRDVLHSS